jgi:hypothetical protein
VDLRHALACELVPFAGSDRAHEPSACVHDGRIYGSLACLMCALVGAGSSFTGVISEMTGRRAIAGARAPRPPR